MRVCDFEDGRVIIAIVKMMPNFLDMSKTKKVTGFGCGT